VVFSNIWSYYILYEEWVCMIEMLRSQVLVMYK
jgi:hypothetical protein